MMRLIKSEFQKLFTIRSTYVLIALSVAITAFVSFYVMGYRGAGGTGESRLLVGVMSIVITNLIFLIGLAGALLVTHEYRYNTIMYALTSSRSRLGILLAKLIGISVYSVVLTLVLAVLAALLTYAGAEVKGVSLRAQDIPVWDIAWRLAFYGWAYSILAFILAVIIRSQVGTIVALIFVPGPVEGLLGLLLKQNSTYLPFSALNAVVQPSQFTHGKAALVVAVYIAVSGLIAAYLFKRRDAN